MVSMMSQITLAVGLLAAALIIVWWYLRYKDAHSERRMVRMLIRLGLDPELASSGDTEAIMVAVRKRCRECQAEDLCERWLDFEISGDNRFCPNAEVFRRLGAKLPRAA